MEKLKVRKIVLGGILMSEKFDIQSVNRKSLVQIDDISVDENKSCQERMEDFLEQLGGRYCYADGDIVVGFQYADTSVSLAEKLASYATTLG